MAFSCSSNPFFFPKLFPSAFLLLLLSILQTGPSLLLSSANSPESAADASVAASTSSLDLDPLSAYDLDAVGPVKKPEDAIPVIEIRGEGKPMSAAQIRELEETSNGGPLDIKVSKTWVPGNCPRKARRLDFVTFHYKGFSEAGKKFDQSYGREKDGIRIQLGVGMVMPGLDKGLKGTCDGELRRIEVPWRLSRKRKSKVWRFVPNDEHWLRFDVEMLTVEPWTIEGQFRFMDLNNDSRLMEQEMIRFGERQRKEFGKGWQNEDIDGVMAAKYYIKYFDGNGDEKVQLDEFKRIFQRDMSAMEEAAKARKKAAGGAKIKEARKRDPGFGWILDFNNDGIVSVQEMDAADQVLQGEPAIMPTQGMKEEL